MYSNNKYPGIDPVIISIVSKKSHQLIKHQCFSESELEDLQQELLIDVLMKIEIHQPKQNSLYGFAKVVVETKANKLIRSLMTQKRGSNTLSDQQYFYIDGEEHNLLDDEISSDNNFNYVISDFSQAIILQHDLEKVIDQLPDDLKEIYQLLQEHSVTETAVITGLSRKTIYKASKTLRTILASFELNEYL